MINGGRKDNQKFKLQERTERTKAMSEKRKNISSEIKDIIEGKQWRRNIWD